MVLDEPKASEMEIEQIEKLRILLHSEDIENVRMGLELCDKSF